MGTHKHFSWRYKRSLFFVGIQEVFARRVHKELISHNLYLFAGPLRVDYGWPFVNHTKFKKYLHSTKYICIQSTILHPANVCSFKELYLFNFKEKIYLLTVKEINSFKEHLFIQRTSIHKKYNHSRQL